MALIRVRTEYLIVNFIEAMIENQELDLIMIPLHSPPPRVLSLRTSLLESKCSHNLLQDRMLGVAKSG